jgi:hypothetical protein
MLYKCFDASRPPPEAPAGCRAVLGYIGGATPHVWSLAEWLRFASLRQFPAWLAMLDRDPVAQARQACQTAARMGWVNDGTRVIVCDTEAFTSRPWYQSWKAEVIRAGYLECNYGSLGTPGHPLVELNGSGRIWAALWDADPVLEGGQLVEAHQYDDDVPGPGGVPVDLSVMEHALFILGGGGPRRAEP